MNDPSCQDQGDPVAKVFPGHAIEEKDLLILIGVDRRDDLRQWCRTNLQPPYELKCLGITCADGLLYAISTPLAEDRALVRLTWQ